MRDDAMLDFVLKSRVKVVFNQALFDHAAITKTTTTGNTNQEGEIFYAKGKNENELSDENATLCKIRKNAIVKRPELTVPCLCAY